MHIAYLHYLAAGDTALHHVRQFAEAARSLGHRVDVHALNPAASETGTGRASKTLSRVRAMAKIYLSRYLHEIKEVAWNWPYYRRELSLLRERRPEILLVRDHTLTASYARTARRLRLPLVVEVNAPALESRLYLHQYLHLPGIPERIEDWKLCRAERIIVVSSALGKYFVQQYGLEASKIETVLNGADINSFNPRVELDPDLPKGMDSLPVIGYVGSFHPWHGVGLLIRMIQDVAAAIPRAMFLVVGDASGCKEFGGLRRSLADRLVLTGPVAHRRVPGLVAAFTIGVVPDAAFYQCPLKVVEWMAAGKAVVAPRYEPLTELIEDGVDGLLFPPGDAKSLSATVTRLTVDPDLCARLGEAAFRKVRSSLTWEHNARRVLSICEKALSRGLIQQSAAGSHQSD